MNIAPKHRWLIVGLYAAGMLVLSGLPAGALDRGPQLFAHQDKVLHALMYGGWAALLGLALQGPMRHRPAGCMAGIVLAAASYGALMEIMQGSLAWIQRTCSWGDMLANLAGAILGIGLGALCTRNSRPSSAAQN